jgi:acyl-CoA dehydrogenase
VDFDIEPEFEQELEWVRQFVAEEIEPVDAVLAHPADIDDPLRRELIPPLQQQVKSRGLWACHLSPELGGMGYGQVKLALINEILGSSRSAPTVFGCQAPDSGNSEILALFGTEWQKKEYLHPLIAGEVSSCFSMTEPTGGADPTSIRTRATQDPSGRWHLNGEKWFASNARYAAFLIVVAVTSPDAPAHQRASMFIVPRGTPGLEVVRNTASAGQPAGDGTHGYLRFTDLTLSPDQLLGTPGSAFAMAQARLGGGRIHHAMRTIGAARRAFDMMLERAVSRTTKGSRLADLQLVQAAIADSWLDLEQFRLLVLRTAWKIDKLQDARAVRGDIAGVKAAMPRVFHDIVSRALQVHGSIGVSDEMPFGRLLIESYQMGLVDGPTEVHKLTLARELLRSVTPSDEIFPRYHLPAVHERAARKFASILSQLPEVEPWY